MRFDERPTVAVVGATGLVGKTMLTVLMERGFPAREIRALASARSAGSELEVGGRSFTVAEATADTFDGVDIALFSAGADQSRALAPEAVSRGTVVIDNSSAWRMDDLWAWACSTPRSTSPPPATLKRS